MDQELNSLKVDIAIIKRDIKQIERFFDKVDTVVDEMSEVAKMIAVQQQLMNNFDTRLEYTHAKIEDSKQNSIERGLSLKAEFDGFRADILGDMQDRVDGAHREHKAIANEVKLWNEKRHTQMLAQVTEMSDGISKRVVKLEQVKWYITGLATLGMLIMGAGHNIFDLIG